MRPNLFELSVTDTGLGIRPEDQEKLLLDFCKLTHSEDQMLNNYGVGLGLSISDAIAKELSNEKRGLILKSEWGQGSTFSFYLQDYNETDCRYKEVSSLPPIPDLDFLMNLEENVSQAFSKSIKTSKSYATSKRPIVSYDAITSNALNIEKEAMFKKKCTCSDILICDDNQFNILSLKLQLHHIGKECDFASLGEIAIQKVREKLKSSCCKFYKHIFMDLEMPVMDGCETSRKIKEIIDCLSYRTKIVAFSGYDAFEERIKAIKSGMEDFLVKPVMERDLRRIVEECFDIRKIRSEQDGIRGREFDFK